MPNPSAARVANLALVAMLALAATGCQPTMQSIPTAVPRSPAPAGSVDYRIDLELFAEVPGGPLAIAAPPDGSGRLFVAAQAGQIWSLDADGDRGTEPMVDLSERIVSGGEQGLLGLAIHPDFPDDPRVFVNFTDLEGDTIVASLEADPDDADVLDEDSFRQYLFVDQPFANHNGGGLAFGPDGFLYIALGDGGGGGDPRENGQRLDTMLGKILRIDVDAGDPYGSPPDNPFVDADGLDEIWHYGLRNPWRFSFDRANGDLWIGDVGQGAWEEIDVARAGEGGLNFGWNRMEGAHCFRVETCNENGLELPVTEYGRDRGSTVIGGYVYRGEAEPVIRGTYLFADFARGTIFAIDAATSTPVTPTDVGQVDGGPSAFGEDQNGELYITTLDGSVYRLSASPI